MHNNWATETGFERHFMPRKVSLVVIIRREFLRGELFFLFTHFVFVISISFLLFGGMLALVLEVETHRLLEIDLNGTTLVLSPQGIVNLDIDLGTVERTITDIVSPRFADLV